MFHFLNLICHYYYNHKYKSIQLTKTHINHKIGDNYYSFEENIEMNRTGSPTQQVTYQEASTPPNRLILRLLERPNSTLNTVIDRFLTIQAQHQGNTDRTSRGILAKGRKICVLLGQGDHNLIDLLIGQATRKDVPEDYIARLMTVLRSIEDPTLNMRIDQFLSLFEEYQLTGDRTSYDALLAEGKEICILVRQQPNSRIEFLAKKIRMELLAQEVDELRRTHLSNPLDYSPLKKPLLANGEIWEEWMYVHISELIDFSPFDDGEDLEAPVRHLLASKMITLISGALKPATHEEIQELPEDLKEIAQELQQQGPELQELAACLNDLESSWNRKWLNEQVVRAGRDTKAVGHYVSAARDFLDVQRALDMSAMTRSAIEDLENFLQISDASTRENMEALRRDLQEGELSIAANLDAIDEANTRIRESLQAQIAQAREDLAALNLRLERAEATIVQMSQRIDANNREIAHLSSQNGANRAALNDGGGGCIIS